MKLLAGFGILLSLGIGALPLPKEPSHVRLSFPSLRLNTQAGEVITSLAVDLSCGLFRQVAIPNDWSLRVVSPVSERTTLRADAGHGSSALRSVHNLDGIVGLSIEDATCFDISAVVVTTIGDQEHRQAFTRQQLRLQE